MPTIDAEKFRKTFEDKFVPEPNSGCWIWIASCNRGGYGQINVCGLLGVNKPVVASRVSWWIYRGTTGSKSVLHTCDNKLCVNPDHLYLGSHKDNSRDAKQRGQMAIGFRLPHTKLSSADVNLIYHLCQNGVPRKEIAKAMKISQPYVSRILSGQRRTTNANS